MWYLVNILKVALMAIKRKHIEMKKMYQIKHGLQHLPLYVFILIIGAGKVSHFYLKTGKRLPDKVSELVINFKTTPHGFFSQVQHIVQYKNQLIIRIQPDEGIKLTYAVKMPGEGFKAQEIDMGFSYSELNHKFLPCAYERLLLDAFLGDNTLFARNDTVEASWNIMDPIIDYAYKKPENITHFYPCGSHGPSQSDEMLAKYGHVLGKICN